MPASLHSRVSEQWNKSSGNSDESSEISDAMRMVRIASEPRPAAESVKSAIRRASRSLGWSYTRTRDVWYGGARRIDAAEMDVLRAMAQSFAAPRLDLERRRHLEQLSALRGRLTVRDPDFHRDDISAIDWLLAQSRPPTKL